jgi:diguanylate cyclase
MTAPVCETVRSPHPPASRPWFAYACVAAALISAGFLVFMLRTKGGDSLGATVDDTGSLATALVAAAACAAAAARNRGHLRCAWALLSLGSFSWALGEGIWSWMAVVQGNATPFPSPADAAYLGGVPILAAGILLLRPTSESIRIRLRSIVDGVIVAAGLLTVSWITVLGSVWSAGGDSPLTLGLSVAYPAGDVLLLSMLVLLAMRMPSGGRLPVVLLIAGIGVQAFSDSGFAYLSETNAYGATNLIDVGYWVGYLLMALAGLRAALKPVPAQHGTTSTGRLALMLPYVPTAAAFGLALWAELDHGLDPFLFTCLAVLVSAVLLRQFLALSDNLRLVRSLARGERQLRHQADHDSMTGLASRAFLRREIDLLRATGIRRSCGLLFIDVDDLKPINDLYGHAGGDMVLRAVATRLSQAVRADDIAARVGGDEFAILLLDVRDAARAGEVADRIIASMASPLQILGDRTVEVSVSIGIATVDRDASVGTEELISRADMAMYAAKAACKGIAVEWSAKLGSSSERVGAWSSELERAVVEHQFVVYYQPIVEAASQRIVAVEALVRWQHPREGLLFPDRFIADLEASDLIVPVGEWVLKTACQQVSAWTEHVGIALDVHVNVSARQLARPDFPHVVRRALESSHLAAHNLVIELTETSLVESHRAAAARLRAIKRLGCRIALDDFGTGYSSLTHLHELPIDVIKVDRSFIRDLSLDAAKPSLAAVLINLGLSMNMQVIAEGVETEEQERALIGLHGTMYQGFYFSPAVQAERLTAMLVAEPVDRAVPSTAAR